MDKTFKPEGKITRAGFATVISRFAELDAESDNTPFAAAGHWAAITHDINVNYDANAEGQKEREDNN